MSTIKIEPLPRLPILGTGTPGRGAKKSFDQKAEAFLFTIPFYNR